ncbi:hypothetical protein O3P69_018868 [Scylla paramamosain]|uniref:Uncharacterized protein n=1 Tax=Scylla paramamosain TaxID=85552 RepID=A0AAW0SSY0_SCYPA
MSDSCPAQWVPMGAKSKIKIWTVPYPSPFPVPDLNHAVQPFRSSPRPPKGLAKMQWKLPASATVVV